jgi:hypothetical protein
MERLFHLFIRICLLVSSYFSEVPGDGDLEKIGTTFFQSIGAKKSKIVDKISSKLEVLNRDGVEIVLVVKNTSKYDSSN